MGVAWVGVMLMHLRTGDMVAVVPPWPGSATASSHTPLTLDLGARHQAGDGLGHCTLEWQLLGRGYGWLNLSALAEARSISLWLAGSLSLRMLALGCEPVREAVRVCTCPVSIQVDLGRHCLPKSGLSLSLLVISGHSPGVRPKISLNFDDS